MPRGGARPNSGPAKGTKYGPQKATVSKEQAREALRNIILKRMERMTAAQLDNCEGIRHMMLRDPATGQFKRVVSTGDPAQDEALIDAALSQGKSAFWFYLKDPSIQAYTDLMNRALDKPKEQAQELHIKGELDVVLSRLAAGRKRANGKGE